MRAEESGDGLRSPAALLRNQERKGEEKMRKGGRSLSALPVNDVPLFYNGLISSTKLPRGLINGLIFLHDIREIFLLDKIL